MHRLDPTTLVTGQIGPQDMPAIAALGVKTIVNNRPDAEEPGQPSNAEIEAAARAAGIAWHHIPVAAGFSKAQVDALADALETPGETLLFCRSGTRSTYLWALARASRGADPQLLAGQVAAAGYDLRPLAPLLGT
jgi:uncharacterized protein (TIGR01244 family)